MLDSKVDATDDSVQERDRELDTGASLPHELTHGLNDGCRSLVDGEKARAEQAHTRDNEGDEKNGNFRQHDTALSKNGATKFIE